MASQVKHTDCSASLPGILTSESHILTSNVGLEEYIESKRLGIQLTQATNRRIRRKIDACVLSVFFVTVLLEYLDKTSLNYANLFSIREHLHLTSSQFAWVTGAISLGHLTGQFCSPYLLTACPTGRLVGASIVLWGISTLAFSWVHGFRTALACRLVQGFVEAPVAPGILVGMGYWWTRAEAPMRYAFIYSSLGWAGIIGSLISTGVTRLSDDGPIARWQFLSILLGGITILWGIVVFFFLPDSPVDARFLSREDKLYATQRVAKNQVGIKSAVLRPYQIKQALLDVKTWTIVLATYASGIPNAVILNFSTELIKDLGFSQTRTTLMNCVGNSFQVVGLIGGGLVASKIRNTRILVATAGNVTCLVAAACLAYLPRDRIWPRLVAFWFTNLQTISFNLALNMISANVAGHTKKQFTSALTWLAYGLGNITGPHFVIQREAPHFPTATKAMMISFAVKTTCHATLGVYLLLSNRHRDRNQGGENTEEQAEDQGMRDKTEFESKALRYVL